MTGFDLAPGPLPPATVGFTTLVNGRSFAICGPGGDISRGIQGIFVGDTRIGSRLVVTVDGVPIEVLATSTPEPHRGTFVGRTPEPHLLVFRDYTVGLGLRTDLRIYNPTPRTRSARVVVELASDLAGLFDVKSSAATGEPVVAAVTDDGLRFGETSAPRASTIRAWPAPRSIAPGRLGWDVRLAPHEEWAACLEWAAIRGGEAVDVRHHCGAPTTAGPSPLRQAHWRAAQPSLRTDVDGLEQTYARSVDDVGALRIFDSDDPTTAVVAAGAPWFMTLFGRDSLVTSWMALLVGPDLGLATARVLARLQGTTADARSEEQPGRILHEIRDGHGASLALEQGDIYYGTADATPLFVMLVHELWRWGVPLDDLRPLLPHVDAALGWIAGPGDPDGDGFVEYARATPQGLENQGWKDSDDAVNFARGELAEPPIALCEVQGYAYAAWQAGAALARAVGDEASARRRADRAAALRTAFNEAFWLPGRHAFAIALNGAKQPVDSIASNMGHCLWTGIVAPERAPAVAQWLIDPRMASGWGVRTLATTMERYDPLSYHNGSVWPHDTAIAIAGLRRAGFVEEMLVLGDQLLAAAKACDYRLPELLSGLTPEDLSIPIPYPASCSPQAWAAAAPLLLVRALLGLEPDLPNGRVAIDPHLPSGASFLHLDGVRFGGATTTIRVDRDSAVIEGLPDGIARS